MLTDLHLFLPAEEGGYPLTKRPTRAEASIMFVRLLGLYPNIQNSNYEHPFSDVPPEANKCVGFLYSKGIAKGVGPETFGAGSKISAKEYCLFILRYLGYKLEAGQNDVLTAAYQNNIISKTMLKDLKNKEFTVDDLVGISYAALFARFEERNQRLIDYMAEKGLVNPNKAEIISPELIDEPLPFYIYFEKGNHSLTVYSKGESGEYDRVIWSQKAASGRTPGRTPTGIFKIIKKERWHRYLSGNYSQYTCSYNTHLYIHSPVYRETRIDTLITGTYKEIGRNASAGCLRTNTGAAYWIYINCPIGTTVEIVTGTPRKNKPNNLKPLNGSRIDPTDPEYVVRHFKKPNLLTSYSVMGVDPQTKKEQLLKNQRVDLLELDRSIISTQKRCILQYDTALKLIKANELFKRDGYRIKVYDAYRPLSIQRELYRKVDNEQYVGNPDTLLSSNHCRGSAVDIILVDQNGVELEMPTSIYTFDKTAHRNSSDISSTARNNVDYLTAVMESCGFYGAKTKWWHFYDKDSYVKYPATDHIF